MLGDAAVQAPHSPPGWVRLCVGYLSPGQGRLVGISLGAVMEARETKDWLGGEGRKEALVSGAGREAGGLAVPRLPAELAPAKGVSWRGGGRGVRQCGPGWVRLHDAACHALPFLGGRVKTSPSSRFCL